VLSLAVYTWAGEKFAWLVLHPLLPLVLLAGVGAQAIWSARRRTVRAAGLAATALALAYVGYASFLANAVHRADPRELLVSTQSSEAVGRVADEVLASRPASITVDASDGATFPWAWYFRDLSVRYAELADRGDAPDSDVLILTEAARTRLAPQLDAYTGREFPFRVWWVRDGSQMSPAAWWRWLTTREPWNPTGGLPEWLYERR